MFVFISAGRDGADGRDGIPGRNGISGRQGLPGKYASHYSQIELSKFLFALPIAESAWTFISKMAALISVTKKTE